MSEKTMVDHAYRRFGTKLAWLVCAGLSLAADCAGSEDAREILIETENRHRTRTQEYSGDLTVVSRQGKERHKAWKSYRDGYAGDSKQLIRFLAPPEVRGVGFLSVGTAGKNPDQWLYLPSMKRERRIATQDRESSFVGTDFNFEDMEEFDQSRYEPRLTGDQVVDGQQCHIIEAFPKEKSVYAKKVLAIRKDVLFLVRMECFKKDEKDPCKRLVLSDIQQVDGHWVARKLEMSDLLKGSRTTVVLKEIAFDRPQPRDRFTLQNLNREEGD
ncbi:MAG: outer membrane lipoprotein-sorting protein [Acidobacteriota bacterium]